MLYVEGTSITPMVDHEHHHSRDNICGYGVVSNDDKVVPDAELSRDAITDAGVFLLLKSSQLRRVPVVLESLSELGTIIINVDRDGCRRGSDDNMLGLMMNDWGRPSQEHEFSIGGSALGGNFHLDAALLEAQGRGSNYAYNTNLKHIRRLEVGLSHKLNMSIGWKVVLGMTLVVHESTRMLYPATLTLDLDDLIYQFAVWMTPHQWEDVKQLWFPHTPELVNKCEINWTRRGHRLTELQYYAGRPNGVGFIGLFCVEVSDFADQLASRQGLTGDVTVSREFECVVLNIDGTAGREACYMAHACYAVLQSWVSKKFMTGCVVLFPVAVTFFITWWFIQVVDGFFSPIYERLGIEIFGLGFITSIIFIFFVGMFASSWLGSTVFLIGEWFIKRMPFVRHIYSASKQISSAISPGYFHFPC
ncbi:hypothetical protein SASPL_149993 [Salvia splendens]|uniref:Uncharacterized protein n=1 Tax=Salvia splendens TaxID=180675 RepID=A0A8X8W617_SALSN|nr:hypothetical protein SASPL_149993 [Salvia splendens]